MAHWIAHSLFACYRSLSLFPLSLFTLVSLLDEFASLPVGSIIEMSAVIAAHGKLEYSHECSAIRILFLVWESLKIVRRRSHDKYEWHGETQLQSALVHLRCVMLNVPVHHRYRTGMYDVPVSTSAFGPLVSWLDDNKQIEVQPVLEPIDFAEEKAAAKAAKAKGDESGYLKSMRYNTREKIVEDARRWSQVIVTMFMTANANIVTLNDISRWLLGPAVIKPGHTASRAHAHFAGKREKERERW